MGKERRKTIFTYVSWKAVQGLTHLAERTGADVYVFPVPYKKSDGRDGWTVAVVR